MAQDPFASLRPLPSRAALRAQQAGLRRAPVGGGFRRRRRGGAAGPALAVAVQVTAGLGGRRARRCQGAWAPADQAGPHLPEVDAAPDGARHGAQRQSAGWLTRTALCVEVRDPQRANGPKAEPGTAARAA
jgi:hypothetical protein